MIGFDADLFLIDTGQISFQFKGFVSLLDVDVHHAAVAVIVRENSVVEEILEELVYIHRSLIATAYQVPSAIEWRKFKHA